MLFSDKHIVIPWAGLVNSHVIAEYSLAAPASGLLSTAIVMTL
jgi:hypothetical protein